MKQRLCGDQWISLWQNDQDIVYVQMDNGAQIVPITPEGDVLLITEPSPAYGQRILGLPSGMIEADEAPEAAANRELQEEIGFKAARLDWIGDLHPFFKYVHCRLSVFLARDLEVSKLDGDEGPDWIIEIERVPLDSFEHLIQTGRLHDAPTIAALYMARRYLEQNPSPSEPNMP
jgi:ADP-ribose diphosphatase